MDYFYAANGFGNKGLQDYCFKSSFVFSGKLKFNADLHQFYSSSIIRNAQAQKMNKNFGTELDLVLNYSMTNIINIEFGYSHFSSTSSLTAPSVKNIPNAQAGNNWAYLMLNIKPGSFLK